MDAPIKIQRTSTNLEEDRLLRFWTPVLLRSILLVAMTMLAIGLALTATSGSGYFVERYQQVQRGHLIGQETFSGIWSNMLAGKPHAVLTLGLFVLTLVPLARVAFCFLLFVRERDLAYVAFTAYVLAGLIAGILLGRVG